MTQPLAGPPVVILAAGHGIRMGGPKIFIRHGSRTFLERILIRCGASASPMVLVVDPVFRAEAESQLAGFAAVHLRIAESAGLLPMLNSVQAGLAVVEDWLPGLGFWLWPVDAPFITAGGWQDAVRVASAEPEAIWKLRVQGKTGHPIWFPSWSVPEIVAGEWGDGLLGFLKIHAGRVRILPMDNEILNDFNTREVLERVSPDK